MYGSIFRNSPQNINYKMLILGEQLPSLDEAVDTAISVQDQFPYWLIQRGEGSPGVQLANFIQEYYDWLYDKGGYKLSTTSTKAVGLRSLLDLDETPVEFLKHFTYTYATGFPEWYVGATAAPDGTDTGPSIRKFIRNIRQGFYQKKSTEEAYQYFFKTLFDTESIELNYPKKYILRLNGGRFAGLDWTIEGGGTGGYDDEFEFMNQTLGGSFLNGPYKIQDSDWYQDFSYLLNAEIDVVDEDTGLPIYYDILQTMLHPVGLKGFFEKTQRDYIPPDDFDGGFQDCEQPKLGNYFPYQLSSRNDIATCIGCSGSGGRFNYAGPTGNASGWTGGGGGTGWTYGDAWATVGGGSIAIGGNGADAFDMPTFAYPHWADGLCGDAEHSIPIQNIYIGDFIYLCPRDRSPNIGITGCTAYEDANAGACWR